MVSVPVPSLPTFRSPPPTLLFQVEPAPVTVTVPVEPLLVPMKPVRPARLITLPPASMLSVPLPKLPTCREPKVFQVEPAPVTVAVPVEPLLVPMKPVPVDTSPPAAMTSVPVPSFADKQVAVGGPG